MCKCRIVALAFYFTGLYGFFCVDKYVDKVLITPYLSTMPPRHIVGAAVLAVT